MTKMTYSLWNDLDRLELGDSDARPGEYLGKQALYLEKAGSAVLLRDDIPYRCFRLQAEVAIPEQVGFIGLVFGARDSKHYELVYLGTEEIQYDPVMNQSMTWQIYHGPLYQKPLPNTSGRWWNYSIEVQPGSVAVYLGDDPSPQLVVTNLQLGGQAGKVGFWGFLPAYIRNLSIEEIQPAPLPRSETDWEKLNAETYMTEWNVSKPYSMNEPPEAITEWTKAVVEENGTLNLNRIYPAEVGIAVQAESSFDAAEETESLLTFGFSDSLRLWINEQEVYQGDWKWDPPVADGRIRSSFVSLPVRWRAGRNTVRAEVTNTEFFGWGVAVQTGVRIK